MKNKKISVVFYCIASLFSLLIIPQFSIAQKLAGMTFSGGVYGGGTIYRINADGNQYTEIKDFEVGSKNPRLILGKDGALYGTTSKGGSKGFGTIFKMNTDGTNYKTIYEFNVPGGSPSYILHASDGKLYGVTTYSNQPTTLYAINTDGSGFFILKSFAINSQIGDLLEAADGKIYALLSEGVNASLFSINKVGSGYSVLQNFSNGPYVFAALNQDSNGDFYGIAPGGANGYGIIFTMKPDGTGFTKLHDFNGQLPGNTLTLGADGSLYGASSGGKNNNGMIFTIKKNGSGFSKIYDLTVSDGSYFQQQLLEDGNGFLYGTTVLGGAHQAGVIFKIKTDGSNYQKIYDFDNNTTQSVYSGQFITANGILYGINTYGAANGAGNIFSIHLDGTGYTSLHEFGGAAATNPYGNIIQGIDSLLYGTTYFGGDHELGIIFSVDGNGQNYKKLYDFDGLNGAYPYQGLTQGPDGYLYGTATCGGTSGLGTLYKIKPDGTGFVKLFDFGDHSNGFIPYASPLIGSDGKLYGTTYGGGSNDDGTIYTIKTDGTGFQQLFDFSSTNGAGPRSSLIQGEDGTLYGMTTFGGIDYGVIFSIKPNGTGYFKLHEFTHQTNDGFGPYGCLLLGKDGKLYGTTNFGGLNTVGTVFSISTDGSNYKKLYDFDTRYGFYPIGSLIQLKDGDLYGITASGGSNSSGVIFSIHPDGTGFKKMFDYPLTPGNGIFKRQNNLISLKLRKQALHFDPIQEVTQGGPSFNLSATASSGLPIIFSSSTSTLATVNGKAVTIINPGKETIAASQPGDGVYDAATPVMQSFCIDPLPPTISFSGGGANLTLTSSSTSGNQWFINNSPIAGAMSQNLILSDPGNYTVKVSIDNCVSQPSDVFVVTEVTDKNQSLEFSVYPNPSKNSINLNLESFEPGVPVEVAIYNMLGLQVDYLPSEGGRTTTIDISKYPNGNFIVTLTHAKKIYHSKFLKY